MQIRKIEGPDAHDTESTRAGKEKFRPPCCANVACMKRLPEERQFEKARPDGRWWPKYCSDLCCSTAWIERQKAMKRENPEHKIPKDTGWRKKYTPPAVNLPPQKEEKPPVREPEVQVPRPVVATPPPKPAANPVVVVPDHSLADRVSPLSRVLAAREDRGGPTRLPAEVEKAILLQQEALEAHPEADEVSMMITLRKGRPTQIGLPKWK